MKKRCIGAICILLGVGVVLFPFIREFYEDSRQKCLLNTWGQEISCIDMEESTKIREQGDLLDKTSDGVVGILKIPAISLEQPILKGATEQNLNIAPSTIEPTDRPGGNGNMAIAGHNSRTYGRLFNRLSELRDGDKILVETEEGSYCYQVTDCFTVNANEVWILEHAVDGAEITLVTCYYPKEGKTQRLVVKGFSVKD